MDDSLLKQIIDSRDPEFTCGVFRYPEPGRYVITALQYGNHQGQQGWEKYVGYVVQVRKKAGAFNSDLIFLRHPDGNMCTHENQLFYYVQEPYLSQLIAMYPEECGPEHEDYTQEYTIGDKYPEIGKVIEPKEDGPPKDNSPLVKITISKGDGSQEVHIV